MNLGKCDYYALFFLCLQILIIVRNYLLADHIIIFYYCDHIPLLFAIGFYFRQFQFIKGLISTGLILQLIYIADLFSKLLLNVHITGTTAYLFSDTHFSLFALIISLLMHITAPIALYAQYHKKIENVSLITSVLYLLFLYVSTLLFTPMSYDINCVFYGCGVSFLQFELYTYLYLIIGSLLLILPAFYIQKSLNYISNYFKKT